MYELFLPDIKFGNFLKLGVSALHVSILSIALCPSHPPTHHHHHHHQIFLYLEKKYPF